MAVILVQNNGDFFAHFMISTRKRFNVNLGQRTSARSLDYCVEHPFIRAHRLQVTGVYVNRVDKIAIFRKKHNDSYLIS